MESLIISQGKLQSIVFWAFSRKLFLGLNRVEPSMDGSNFCWTIYVADPNSNKMKSIRWSIDRHCTAFESLNYEDILNAFSEKFDQWNNSLSTTTTSGSCSNSIRITEII